MATDHALPSTTSTYALVISQFKDRIDDIAKGLDVTGATNIPENAIRWDSASNNWKKYTAVSGWGPLTTLYNININGTVGATTASTGAFTTLSTSGVATLGASSTVGGVAIVGVSGAQTLTNKTLTSPKISSISNTGIISLPTDTTTLIGTDTTDTLTNKTLTTPKIASSGSINDTAATSLAMLSFGSVASAVNNLKVTNSATGAKPALEVIGTDTNISLNLVSKGTGTVQANGVNIVTVSSTDTLTNKTLTSPKISSISNTGTITLPTDATTLVGRDTTDTLTNKTLTTPKIVDGGSINDAATVSLPMLSFGTVANAVNNLKVTNAIATATPVLEAIGTDVNISLNLKSKGTGTVQANGVNIVTISSTQTLTNKTLTTPTIASVVNSGTITFPTDTTTLVGRNTTDTLTNKTLSGPKIGDGTSIYDTSSTPVPMLSFSSVGLNSANYLKITNAIAANAPKLSAIGSATNISFNLEAKGTGTVQANGVDIVTTTGGQTLTNKTLTEPSITTIRNTLASAQGPTVSVITLPINTTTLVGTDTTDTLTNKTISTSSSYQGSAIAVDYGGTGGTTAATARAGLGLVIGTDIPSLVGAGASGTWSINISGNAANGGVTSVNGSTGAVTLVTGVSSVNGSTGAVTVTPKAPIVTDTFTASGTWTKPTGGQTMATIQLWGAGGSGGRWNGTGGGAGGGGGGGGYSIFTIPLVLLTNLIAVTVGAGGAAVSASMTNGNAGGNTFFGVYAYADGGKGGSGVLDVDSNFPGGAGGIAMPTSGIGRSGGYGSGSGGVGVGGSTTVYFQGAGGGGGGVYSGGGYFTGGTSTIAGNGGTGGSGSVNAVAGAVPGGGGGGAASGISGAGGAGRVIVTCW